ncbi:MAG: hypothetical protein KKE20_03870 [Nanoarchaeota archaeon]|nr:hypothetical protein [Nanoarchaeota archaeon]
MSVIGYFKAEPNEFARMSVNGQVKKQGTGISGIYLPFRTSIELVSVSADDQGFVFKEMSSDKQEITLQGGFVYRITQPEIALGLYNFSIDPGTKEYQGEDYMKLPQNIQQLVHAEARKIIQAEPLEKLIVMNETLSNEVYNAMKKSELVPQWGINLQMVYFSNIMPKPEIAKALEATYREGLLQKEDEASYGRRALGVEKERAIRENEMATEIGIEEKRKALVGLQAENIMSEAKADAKRLELEIFKEMGAEELRALALLRIGENAARISHLSITPDLITALKEGVKPNY